MFRTARGTTGHDSGVSFTALACENICGRIAWIRPRCAHPLRLTAGQYVRPQILVSIYSVYWSACQSESCGARSCWSFDVGPS